MMSMTHYWILAGVFLLTAEIFTPGFLLAGFGLGSFTGGLLSFFGFPPAVQIFGFSLITMVFFFTLRPFLKRFLIRSGDGRETGVKAYVGKVCKVTEAVDNMNNTGRVQIGSESWRVKAETEGQCFAAGTAVEVSGIEGATLIVREPEKR